MRRRLIIFVTLAVLAAAATFAAVSGASFTTASSTAVRAATAPLSGDTLRADAGDGQTATAGTAVAVAPSVKVTDAGGNPVSGVAVTFAVASGGGSVTDASAVTDSSGVAAAAGWTLGTTAGVNKLTATASGLVGSVTFTATGTAGAAETIAINGGDNQSATAGAAVAIAPSVRVTDAGGNPVSGVAVTFAASGNGSATGATQTTGASGIATVGCWTLGTTAGSDALTATATGLTGSPLTFTATATAGPTATVAVSGGNNQSATVNTAVDTAPSVEATDQYGNAVSGALVTFELGSAGGSVTGAAQTTDSSGIATLTSWTLGQTAGVNILTASVTGAVPATFTATGTADSFSQWIVTSSNYAPVAGSTVTITAQMADSYGNATTGASTTVSLSGNGTGYSLAGTGGSTTSSYSTTLTASPTAGQTFQVTASSPVYLWIFVIDHITGTSPTITTVAGSAASLTANAGDGQTATVAAAVGTAPSVKVTDQYGNGVAGTSVSFAVASGGGSATGLTAITDDNGVATVGSWKLGTSAGANTLTATSSGLGGSPVSFTATGVAGAASRYGVTTPHYSVRSGTTVTISAQLQDTYGNAVGTPTAVSVTWSRGNTNNAYGTLLSTTSTTNPSGVATVQFTASSTTGRTNTIIAKSTNQTSVTGTSPIITSVGAASRIAAHAGTSQTATVGSAVAIAPSVKVTDSGSRPIPGTSVTFAVASGGGSATGLTAITDDNGVATVGSWKLGTSAGANTLTATSGGLSGSPVSFTATGVAGAATRLAIETAADGSGSAIAARSLSAGTNLTGYAVTRDAYSNFVANVAAAWSLPGSTGGVVSADLVAAGDTRSAVFSGHLVGTTSMQAVSGGLSDSTGTLTVTADVPAEVTVTSSNYNPTGGSRVTITAVVVDQWGNPVGNVIVAFSKDAGSSGGGSFSPSSSNTDSSGIATTSFTTGGSGRTYYVKATASSVSGTTLKIATK